MYEFHEDKRLSDVFDSFTRGLQAFSNDGDVVDVEAQVEEIFEMKTLAQIRVNIGAGCLVCLTDYYESIFGNF